MKNTFVAVGCLALALTAGMVSGQDKGKGKGGKGKGGAPAAALVGDAAKGKDVFGNNCAVCHKPDSAERVVGPGLKELTKHPMLVNGKPMNDANLATLLNEGTQAGMPPFADLAPQEKADLLAYLKTL